MAGEWQEIPVADVCEIFLGGTPKRSDPTYWGGSIKWASAKDVANCRTRYLTSTQETITQKGINHSAAKLLDRKTIVITARGTVGALCMLGEPMSFNQTCYGLVGKHGTSSHYLYYALKAAISQIRSISYGTVFDTITMKSFKNLMVPLPSQNQQRAIAHILGSLDDKIELNRRMNETLEAMARAIFKSWFVDFDPVRAKAEGRDPGLPSEIAALFPDSFQDSELGLIPKGWDVKTIDEVVEFAYGKALKASNRKSGSIPVFGSNGPVGLHNEALVKGPGIVIGRKGNPGIVTWSSKDFFPIDTTFYAKQTGILSSLNYLFYALKCQNLPALSADSAVPGLNRNLAYMSSVLVPSEKVLTAFDEQIDPLFQRIDANGNEEATLASLRDTLLPKLISGELRVPDLEKFVEKAGL